VQREHDAGLCGPIILVSRGDVNHSWTLDKEPWSLGECDQAQHENLIGFHTYCESRE
jgi:hypothetical protein